GGCGPQEREAHWAVWMIEVAAPKQTHESRTSLSSRDAGESGRPGPASGLRRLAPGARGPAWGAAAADTRAHAGRRLLPSGPVGSVLAEAPALLRGALSASVPAGAAGSPLARPRPARRAGDRAIPDERAGRALRLGAPRHVRHGHPPERGRVDRAGGS